MAGCPTCVVLLVQGTTTNSVYGKRMIDCLHIPPWFVDPFPVIGCTSLAVPVLYLGYPDVALWGAFRAAKMELI